MLAVEGFLNDITKYMNRNSLTICDYTLIHKKLFIKLYSSSINYIYKTMKFLEHESENTPKETIFYPGFSF